MPNLGQLLFSKWSLSTNIGGAGTRCAPGVGDARGSSGERRHTPSAQEAELAGAVRVPNALHTAVVVAGCSIATGAVSIGKTHHTDAVGCVTYPKSAVIVRGAGHVATATGLAARFFITARSFITSTS